MTHHKPMWILIKISVALIAGLCRFFSNRLGFDKTTNPAYVNDDVSVFVTTSKNKHRVTATTFSCQLKTRALFKLTEESSFDRFFKALGLATEVQSGDAEFDRRVYIACDHPIFSDEIKSDAEARRLITKLFDAGVKQIWFDGRFLRARLPLDQTSNYDVAHTLTELQKCLVNMDFHRPPLWGDPYEIRVFVTEIIIWTFAGYSLSGGLELLLTNKDYYLNPFPVYIKGALFGLFLAVVLLFAIFQFFKGSSRGHRILLESGIVLIFSLPLGGMNLVSDLNRNLDRSEPVYLEVPIVRLEEQAHRSRRGGTRYTYHMYIDSHQNTDPSLKLPSHIRIDRETYVAGRTTDIAKIKVGRGWLGHPWYQEIHFRRPF